MFFATYASKPTPAKLLKYISFPLVIVILPISCLVVKLAVIIKIAFSISVGIPYVLTQSFPVPTGIIPNLMSFISV